MMLDPTVTPGGSTVTLGGSTRISKEDQQTIAVDRNFFDGSRHGIFREWNEHGRLSRGFSQYFVNGTKIVKRQFIRAAGTDKSLSQFREEDNDPSRVFPNEISKQFLRQKDA